MAYTYYIGLTKIKILKGNFKVMTSKISLPSTDINLIINTYGVNSLI